MYIGVKLLPHQINTSTYLIPVLYRCCCCHHCWYLSKQYCCFILHHIKCKILRFIFISLGFYSKYQGNGITDNENVIFFEQCSWHPPCPGPSLIIPSGPGTISGDSVSDSFCVLTDWNRDLSVGGRHLDDTHCVSSKWLEHNLQLMYRYSGGFPTRSALLEFRTHFLHLCKEAGVMENKK